MPLFIAGAAFVSSPVSARSDTSQARSDTSEKAELTQAFSVLHATAQWGNNLSDMADKKAKSDLVKDYARSMAAANAGLDAKLQLIANKHGIGIVPLDPQTEEGKSMLERMKGETALLDSLDGDAWDKEYMVLVTNTQQSLLRLLKTSKESARDQEVKQFLGDLTTTVQNRLKTAQDIMAKIYGDKV
jgi:predicted outer membrane protein